MPPRRAAATGPTPVDAIKHADKRANLPTADAQDFVAPEVAAPVQLRYPRDPSLDPQLVWKGKDALDGEDLVADAPAIYIQEKIDPRAIIENLRRTADRPEDEPELTLFDNFDGLGELDLVDFYRHQANWSNRMSLGDSLNVMASLAEREALRGKVQMIYIDPPYGIKFGSNWQVSTRKRDVKDGKLEDATREVEQIKAFRDTWELGIHSYLTYLRDRLTVAKDLLTETGCCFVQIGDENVHLVRSLLDEVFGSENFAGRILFYKTSSESTTKLPGIVDSLLIFAKHLEWMKFRQLRLPKKPGDRSAKQYTRLIAADMSEIRSMTGGELAGTEPIPDGWEICTLGPLTSMGPQTARSGTYRFRGQNFPCPANRHWSYDPSQGAEMDRLAALGRMRASGRSLRSVLLYRDNPMSDLDNVWLDTGTGSFTEEQVYVVQTANKVVQRCILMATDPGDIVLDPTCGSGTTAYVAEQWGRRWITIDTSRVALALARARIMGARYPYYLLADSREGQIKEGEITRTAPSTKPVRGDIRHGFVYERVPHITLKSIANNAEIDVIWQTWQAVLEPLREALNAALEKSWQEWEIPREAEGTWPEPAKKLHADWWQARIARQKEIDASIAAKAEFEYLYDKPYPDSRKVRVAGPFTVESLSPHRVLGVDENDELIDTLKENGAGYSAGQSFPEMILENLKTAGVQQAHKQDRITFTALTPWPGDLVCAEGRYLEGDAESGAEKRAAIFIGPEFGTVTRPDLVQAAREAGDAGFDVLIACAFNYEAHATEFSKLGRIPVLKARMNADLHMAEDLKNTGKGNLFVIFGEPDIDLIPEQDGKLRVKVKGVDVFKPQTGEVISDNADGIACWFIDTDYNEESFFVRHAYFLGANDPYSALKTTLKAEINQGAWESLHSDTSRPFDKPKSGRIAVKVINHLGDEVMKIFKVRNVEPLEPGPALFAIVCR